MSVDFGTKTLKGRASLHLDRSAEAEALFLDTRDLTIDAVWWSTTPEDEPQSTDFELGPVVGFLGQELRIPLSRDAQVVHVDYTTSPAAAAVQWLDPAQTAGGEQPSFSPKARRCLPAHGCRSKTPRPCGLPTTPR